MKSLLVLLFSCKHLSGRVTGRTDVELYSWQPRWLTGKKIGRWARRVPPFEMDKTRYMNARLSARASLGPRNIDLDMFCSTIWTLTLLNVHLHAVCRRSAEKSFTSSLRCSLKLKSLRLWCSWLVCEHVKLLLWSRTTLFTTCQR